MIQLDDNYFLYPEPFTFSKVKAIYFQDEEQMGISVFNLEISSFPFPKWLLRVDEEGKPVPPPKKRRIPRPKQNFARPIRLYSKYLGAYAIAKNVIKKEVEFPKSRYFTAPKYRQLEKMMLPRYHRSPISEKMIENMAKREKIQIRKNIIQNYDHEKMPIGSFTYIITILRTYRYIMSDNLSGLMKVTQHLDEELRHTFMLLYGLMLGYAILPFKGYVDTKFRFNKAEDFKILDVVYHQLRMRYLKN